MSDEPDLQQQLADMRSLAERTARDRDQWQAAWSNERHRNDSLQVLLGVSERHIAFLENARDGLAAQILLLEAELAEAEQTILSARPATHQP